LARSKRIVTWSLAAVLLALVVTRVFFINFYRIPQNGMYPGLPAGSRLFVNKRAYSVPSDRPAHGARKRLVEHPGDRSRQKARHSHDGPST
jgi:signal peptidase I